MLLGIDVGGTFTDAVLIAGTEICALAKVPTTHEKLLTGITAALDKVLSGAKVKQFEIERVVLSSTIVTNCLTEGRTDPVLLAVMTGPGMNPQGLFPVEAYEAQGYVDHRGKVVAQAKCDLEKVRAKKGAAQYAAVSGKFAVRNQVNEEELKRELSSLGFAKIFTGSSMCGELNFVRRTNAAYFSAAVYRQFAAFAAEVKDSLTSRKIASPIHILKADGGTLPLAYALEVPVEAIYTGPAASVLGIAGICPPVGRAISLDVGGTTTDIAFWQDGRPVMARRGARIAGYDTSVRSYHMRSVGIGGDSKIERREKGFSVGPERAGRAAALGGAVATLGDALIACGRVSFGERQLALKALAKLTHEGEDVVAIAKVIVDTAVQRLACVINEMLYDYSIQPVYTVNDVVSGNLFVPTELIGVGGGAQGLITALGEKMHLKVTIPQGAMVANAIGAALARPTLSATLRADTTEGFYIIPEGKVREKLKGRFTRKEAEQILTAYLQQAARERGITAQECEVVSYEEFTTIHDYYSTGKIIYLKMQLTPGILGRTVAGEVEL